MDNNDTLRNKLAALGIPAHMLDQLVRTADPAKVDALLAKYGPAPKQK